MTLPDTKRNLTAFIQVGTGEFSPETLNLTTKLLTQNPEFYTLWNKRRLILLKLLEINNKEKMKSLEENQADLNEDTLKVLKGELEFLTPLLLKFPKCYWLWNHRIWCIQQIKLHLGDGKAKEAWQNELDIVNRMLGKDNRNFHGWNYRRLVVKSLIELSKEAYGSEEGKIVEQEFLYTTKMINANLSNFSAWHQRSRLLPDLLNKRQSDNVMRIKMLDDEFEMIQAALYTDPYDQSLWFYYHFLMSVATSEKTEDTFNYVQILENDRAEYLKRAIKDLREMLVGAEDCKWLYLALLHYTLEYGRLAERKNLASDLDLRNWLSQLRELDPLRAGRWNDLAASLL